MAETMERRMVRTYLDEVPWGDDEFLRQEEEKTRKERKKLPVGCQDSTLYKDIMRIAWPSLVELFLASLASMVDMMMVGQINESYFNCISDNAVAAVNLAARHHSSRGPGPGSWGP